MEKKTMKTITRQDIHWRKVKRSSGEIGWVCQIGIYRCVVGKNKHGTWGGSMERRPITGKVRVQEGPYLKFCDGSPVSSKREVARCLAILINYYEWLAKQPFVMACDYDQPMPAKRCVLHIR
jgi:hypothetical protein